MYIPPGDLRHLYPDLLYKRGGLTVTIHVKGGGLNVTSDN
jgi:hypothetical protein